MEAIFHEQVSRTEKIKCCSQFNVFLCSNHSVELGANFMCPQSWCAVGGCLLFPLHTVITDNLSVIQTVQCMGYL